MKKKVFITIAVIVALGLCSFIWFRSISRDALITNNIEALSDGEEPVEFPCVPATSVCHFVASAGGVLYNASVTGLKNP